MRLDFGFRLSSYLTLGLATIALGQAELYFLPGIPFFVVPVLILLVIAFLTEGRWCMPTWAANLLGLGIAAGSGLWITLCLIRPGPNPLEGIPLPVALLPYLGPLLAILLIAKLFRPKKPNDYWLLQGMGLLQVGLGCVLANDIFFGVLLLAYLASGLWFLTIFYLQRELSPLEPETPSDLREAAGSFARTPRLFWPVGRWTLAVGLASVALFLLIPRFGATQWSLLGPLGGVLPEGWSSQTGLSEMIDLHRIGTVTLNNEVALVVHAREADGSSKLNLSEQTRWRGAVLDRYHDGRWLSSSAYNRQMERVLAGTGAAVPQLYEAVTLSNQLPDLGPLQYTLTYTADPHVVGGLVLAEPVVVRPGKAGIPAAVTAGYRHMPEFQFVKSDWTLLLERYRDRQELSYQQVTVPLEEANLSVPVRLEEAQLLQLTAFRGSSLRVWTEQLLLQLADQSTYGLTPEELDYGEAGTIRHLQPTCHESAARALCAYLATSGEYTYTLNLRRHDRRMEPTEDFLRNVRQGHCERYAAALAMMLRSQGVPARVIKGFRGCENLGDGRYLIRHSDAHSWVEALVPRKQPDGTIESHWLTLDPTPSLEAPEMPRYSVEWWWENGQNVGRMAWKDYVMEYDVEQQTALCEGSRLLLANSGRSLLTLGTVFLGGSLTLGALGAVGFWLGRRYWTRRRGAAGLRGSEVIFYSRLQSILSCRCQLRPEPAQTPREFGESARRLLRSMAAAAPLADVPARVASLFYRVRFGHQPLSATEQHDLDQQLQRLDTALAQP